ncbi:zinc finger MYM-type protein 1-like [Centruroides vittatus]|uniref:zinc finger MYM-type protein 1-like n=1 Tax=Centruroides vittatus TaxID=120091 RepID=UPI00351064E2
MHLEKSTVFTGLSNKIQNELVNSLGNVLLQEIKKEIENAKFVAIIVDETTDISHRAQMSTVFRYVKENGNVEERFVGFTDASENRDANSLFTHIKSYLDEFQCTKKLVAQTYDGAAVMAGQHNGVRAKIKEISKHAIFVHCYAHRLNLVFSQSVGYIKECKIFFQTMTGFSSFFSKSSKRSHALDLEVNKRFPSATPIRWNYNSRIVNCVMEYKEELKLLLLNMVESPEQWDSDTTIAKLSEYLQLLKRNHPNLETELKEIMAQHNEL